MLPLQNPLVAAALLFAATGAGAAPEPLEDSRMFVPPVGDDTPQIARSGTNCIAWHRVRATRILAGEGIVYQMAGKKALINRPRYGVARLHTNQILITRTPGMLLCAGDIVYLADSLLGETAGFVALGRFETYPAAIKN